MDLDLYTIVCAVLVVGLIVVIISGAFRNFSYKARGLALSITTLLLTIIFTLVLIIDKVNSYSKIPVRYYIYFIAVSLISFLAIALPTLIKGIKYGYGNRRKEKMIYTYHKKEEHIYLVYKYGSYVYLLNDNNTGINYTLKSNEFTDDVLLKLNLKYKAVINPDYERIGMVTVKGKKVDEIYYCYVIDINNPLNDDRFCKVSLYEIGDIEIPEFDKYLILNSLMGDYFEITR